MNTTDRKKTAVIQKYIAETFSDGDWANLGQITNAADIIYDHPRLMRSKANGDNDYDFCVAEVINTICNSNEENINLIIDFYDIDLWYEQKDKLKFERIFQSHLKVYPQYWKNGYLKVFISHLAISKEKAKSLKDALGEWGMSSFVAHEDIEPTKEWMTEIESGLNTMDILIAMVEPGFKESNWTDQEIGYALGRQIEIIPMRIGADPHGFLGKYQGIQAKGRRPPDVAKEILSILLKKPKIRTKLISALNLGLANLSTLVKTNKIRSIEALNLLNHIEMKEILEASNLTTLERNNLNDLISKYNVSPKVTNSTKNEIENDLPF